MHQPNCYTLNPQTKFILELKILHPLLLGLVVLVPLPSARLCSHTQLGAHGPLCTPDQRPLVTYKILNQC